MGRLAFSVPVVYLSRVGWRFGHRLPFSALIGYDCAASAPGYSFAGHLCREFPEPAVTGCSSTCSLRFRGAAETRSRSDCSIIEQ